jgi:hypothetical protein
MKMMFYIFLLFTLVSCVNKQPQKINIDNDEPLIEGIDFVILHYDIKDDEWMEYLFENSIASELTIDDLGIINNILSNAIYKYNMNESKDIILSKYKRQYIAVYNEYGEKEVYINCFNAKYIEELGYWKTKLVVVRDGGNNFFQLKINLSKKIYYDFFVNGYA